MRRLGNLSLLKYYIVGVWITRLAPVVIQQAFNFFSRRASMSRLYLSCSSWTKFSMT